MKTRNKTTYHIAGMDCPSEEQLIRSKLEGQSQVERLDFDLKNRELTVYHLDDAEPISEALNQLNLGSNLRSSENGEFELPAENEERKILWAVLIINAAFFIIEMIAGLVADSMGLVADSLDMLADAFVYAISLLVVGSTLTRKKMVAGIAGYFQVALAIAGLVEVIRRFVADTPLPDFQTMIIVSAFALVGNAVCLYLLQRSRSKEAHMQASMIFTSNDVIINIGVIAAGGAVTVLDSRIPDLIIGSIVFIVVLRGAIRILKLSR